MAISIKEAAEKRSFKKFKPSIDELIKQLEDMSYNYNFSEDVLDDVKHVLIHLRRANNELDNLIEDMEG